MRPSLTSPSLLLSDMSCCALFEDVTSDRVPPNLKLLLSSLSSPDPSDYVLLAVYTLMLEAGFTPVGPDFPSSVLHGRGFSVRRLEAFNRLPPGWDDKTRTLQRVTFQMEDLSEHKCQFVVLRIGGMITVNLAVENHPSSFVREPLYTMPVLPWEHVEETPDGLAFKDARRLADAFRETMVAPVVCGIYRRYGFSHASLVGIPHEVTLKILHCLPAAGVCAVSQTCRSLNSVCQDDMLWQHLYARDKITPPPDGGDADVSFKSKYSKAVVWESIAKRKRRVKPLERRVSTNVTRCWDRRHMMCLDVPHCGPDVDDWGHMRIPDLAANHHHLAQVYAHPWH